MRWFFVGLVAFLFVKTGEVQADVTLQNGLFLQAPDLAADVDDQNFHFQGTVENDNLDVGISFSYGPLVFGFESFLNDRGDSHRAGSAFSNISGNISAGLSVLSERTHRILMGWRLPNKTVMYGFNGITDRRVRSNASYSATSDFTYYKTTEVYENCVWVEKLVPYSGTYTSAGFGESEQSNFGYTFGGGFEQQFLGGILRLEYSATRFDELSQSLSLNHTSSNADFRASGPDTREVHWDDYIDQKVQLRWQVRY